MRIKKILAGIILIPAMFSLSNTTLAFKWMWWENVNVNEDIKNDVYIGWADIRINKGIDGNLTIGWGKIQVDGNVSKSIIIAWWQIEINGNVGQDIIVFWWDIVIKGAVWGRVVSAWGTISVENAIGWDLIMAWWDLKVRKTAVINWDAVIWWWMAEIDWVVKWASTVEVEQLILNWTFSKDAIIKVVKRTTIWDWAKILWNLNYEAKNNIPELEKITTGKKEYKQNSFAEDNKKEIINLVISYLIMAFTFIFLMSILLYFMFPKSIKETVGILKKDTLKSFWVWMLYFVFIPIIIILCFISTVLIPVWFFLLFAYIFWFVFYKVINTVVISWLIIEKFENLQQKTWKKVLVIFWISLISSVLSELIYLSRYLLSGQYDWRKLMCIKKLRGNSEFYIF